MKHRDDHRRDSIANKGLLAVLWGVLYNEIGATRGHHLMGLSGGTPHRNPAIFNLLADKTI